MKKLSIFLLALVACAGTMFASAIYKGGIWYNFDHGNRTAEVTYRGPSYYAFPNEYTGDVVIPSSVTYNEVEYSVTSIGWGAFYDSSGLISVTIPNSVTSIGDEAFWNCTGLTSVTIGNSVTSIGDDAFYRCSGLTSVTIPNSVTSIGGSAFSGCRGLTSVSIPNSVTSIGSSAFSSCSGLTSVTIGKNVASIGSSAFSGCKIKNIIFSGTMEQWVSKSWNPSVISSSYSLSINDVVVTNAVIPNTITSIGNYAFARCTGLTSVTIPNSVTSIGSQAFVGCSGLTSVHISDLSAWCAINFGDNPLSYAHNLYLNGELVTELVIPNSVTSIGREAFRDCTGLTSVTIPNSVTSIGREAFRNCSGLTSVTIPNSVTSIGGGAFAYCSNLTTIDVAPDNPYYCSEEGVLFNRDKTTLVAYPIGKQGGKYTIPNSVTSIGGSAFEGCTGLTSIEIPNSVTSIGGSAFEGCTGLTSVTIPNSVTSIGNYAFSGCSGLNSVTCESTTPPDIGSNAFSKKSIPLYVPAESVDAYKAADQWKDFNVQAITGIEPAPETEEVNCNIRYVDKDVAFVSSEQLTFNVPEAPAFDGFTFLRWEFVGGPMSDGLTIQAVYQANPTTSAPAVVTNPANPAQKLIREGNVYILHGNKTYTIQGQAVR